jgi:hypothetical protein
MMIHGMIMDVGCTRKQYGTGRDIGGHSTNEDIP